MIARKKSRFDSISSRDQSFFCWWLHVSVFFSFAVSQPLYSVLSAGPEFLLAHSLSGWNLVLFTIVLSAGVPIVGIVTTLLLGVFGPRVQLAGKLALVAFLVFLATLPIANRIGFGATITIIASLGSAAALTALYVRSAAFRSILTFCSPVVLLFPMAFLFASPARGLVFPQTSHQGSAHLQLKAHDVPIFYIVFDELSTVLLLDESARLDTTNFPNFARLAASSTWFRQSTTNSSSTQLAVPTLLTGRFPENGRLPTLSSHPVNLFTLLSPAYEVLAYEGLTSLCPEEICSKARRRIQPSLLISDLTIVYSHIIFPEQYRDRLPTVAGKWSGFAEPTPGASDQTPASDKSGIEHLRLGSDAKAQFEEFISKIDHRSRGRLHFIHSLLPHIPWVFLPDGRLYTLFKGMDNIPGWLSAKEQWGQNQALADQGYQRALLQTQLVDRLLGHFLDRLDELELFEEALIVVTADHGVNFEARRRRRGFSGSTIATGVTTPLFVKVPGQVRGEVSDRRVQGIDVLPTLLSVIGDFAPDSFDGEPVLTGNDDPSRSFEVLTFSNAREKLPEDMEKRLRTAAKQKALRFHKKNEKLDYYHLAGHSDLIGRTVGDLLTGPPSDLFVTLDESEALLEVKPESVFVPSFFKGWIGEHGEGVRGVPFHHLAIAIDDTVVAVALIYEEREHIRFSVIVPPMHLKAGRNQVAFFAVFNREGEPHRLTRLLSAQSLIYKVTGTSGRTHHLGERVDRHVRFEEGILVGPTGEPLVHNQKRLVGSLGEFSLSADGVLYVRGWITDRAKWKEATAYLIVSGVNRLLARPAVFRPDLSAGIRNSGFESFLQLGDADTDIKNVRLFIIFDDTYYAEMRHELRVMQ